MTIYEVFYIDYEHVNNNVYDEDGFHDDYFDYDIKIKRPIKYFDTEEKAKSYIDNKDKADYDKDYYYQAIEVE